MDAGVDLPDGKLVRCANRNLRRNVRVNQDCTFRRQAEEDIIADPGNPRNLVAGMNDSLVGWNRTSLNFSVDGGRHWGAISTAPFGHRLNDPNDLELFLLGSEGKRRPPREDRPAERHASERGPSGE